VNSPDAAFGVLQRRLHPLPAHESAGHGEQTIVVLPSFDVDEHILERHVVTQPAFEERFLYLLFLLRRPDVRVIFTSSLPVDQDVVDYYLGFLRGPAAAGARARLRLFAAEDASPRPLAAKLLERTDLIGAIRAQIEDPQRAFILPYNVGGLERDLALALDLPVYGPSPELSWFGTKCGSREMFRMAGVPLPEGSERVGDVPTLTAAIEKIRAIRPQALAVVVKLNDRVYGEGNRMLSLGGLPGLGKPAERDALEGRVRSLGEGYLADLAADPGIVEELIDGHEISSPSVVLRILADRTPGLVYTQDQMLGGESGQTFVGSRFPAAPDYAELIVREGVKVRDRLLDEGMVGRFGVDFVVTRDVGGAWRAFAVEINLREGGTSHPFGALYLLTDGRYDPATSTFHTARGRERYYTGSDDLENPRLVGEPIGGLIELAREVGLQYDPETEIGCVFHMLRSLPVEGKCGVTAIGASREHADELYAGAQEVLANLAGDRGNVP